MSEFQQQFILGDLFKSDGDEFQNTRSLVLIHDRKRNIFNENGHDRHNGNDGLARDASTAWISRARL